MALSYSIEGKGVIANADSTSADTGHPNYPTTSGSWAANGSGGASISLTTDTFYYGAASIAAAVSGANKFNWITYDIQSGHELDFGASGTEENQFIYIWVHCPTIGLAKTLANEGVSIRVGSSTSDYRIFTIAGSDDANGWDGRWKCFVIDPTQTGSLTDVGTPNLSSIRYIGAQLEVTATAKGDNLFVSQIAVGSGLRITGSSTVGWSDAVVYCTDLANRAWGMLQEREGIYYAYGNIIMGSSTASLTFSDSGRYIQFGLSEYYGSGSSWISSLPDTACGVTLEDDGASTFSCSFTDGVLVGTENGRSGSSILGNGNENIFFDASGIGNAASDINLYNTTFRSCYGAITLADDSDHAYLNCSWVDCAQVDPSGGPIIKNSLFAETSDIDAAFLWNSLTSTTNFRYNNFIANTVGAGIEHAAQATEQYQDINFSGNTFDLLYSAAASSGVLTIQATDSNVSTSEITNPTGNSVSIQNSVTITLTGLVNNTEVTVYEAGTTTLIDHVENVTGNQFAFTTDAANDVDIRIHHIAYYRADLIGYTTPSSSASVPIQQVPDPNYVNN